MNTSDFLLELGCEELPPKLLPQLSKTLTQNLSAQLSAADLSYNKVSPFATPRRLAVLVQGLQTQQNNQNIERKGPAVGANQQAIEGFAKSCGVSIADLGQKSFDIAKADYYHFAQHKKGLKTKDLLADIVKTAIKNIPIAKPMRWGEGDFSFVRPVHWLVMLFGSKVIDADIMGLKSGNITYGMRWTGAAEFCIQNAQDYQKTLLDKAQIEVDFDTRRALIRTQIEQVATDNNATAIIDKALLDEVCALVEYPLAFAGKFDAKFLDVPKEALISAMKLHQKYFHIVDNKGQLLPAFIAVSNIKSSDLSVIIDGNQRVIRPRLSDAQFFWQQDKSISLESRLDKLKGVLFMQDLGSMADKVKRIEALSIYISAEIDVNSKNCARAALLCKSDLVSDMVGEFADLQGVMGGYYALNDGETKEVAQAISEHYHPRFSGDSLPSTKAGLVVAIADKVDSIVGIYGIGHQPTGSKDPYALKRAGLGLMRIIIESKLKVGLLGLVRKSGELHKFDNEITSKVYDFISQRLGAYYQEQGIDKNIVKAVLAARNATEHTDNSVYDWHLRIKALKVFMQDERSQSLVEANKRIKNILKDIELEKTTPPDNLTDFDKELFSSIINVQSVIGKNKGDYMIFIEELLKLKPVIDNFFDNVMVNDKDLGIRNYRLNQLNKVGGLFFQIADFAYLSQ